MTGFESPLDGPGRAQSALRRLYERALSRSREAEKLSGAEGSDVRADDSACKRGKRHKRLAPESAGNASGAKAEVH